MHNPVFRFLLWLWAGLAWVDEATHVVADVPVPLLLTWGAAGLTGFTWATRRRHGAAGSGKA